MEDKTRALSMIRKLRDDKGSEIDKLATEVDFLDELLVMVNMVPERYARTLAWLIDQLLQ